jgi:multiple sugar transport system permease protein
MSGAALRRPARTLGMAGLYLFLCCGAVLMVIPFLWMISGSLKTPLEILSLKLNFIPSTFRWMNYPDVFAFIPAFGRIYFNTVFRTVMVVAGQVVFAAMAAYAFARLDLPGKNVLFPVVLAVLMVPGQATLIPNYILFTKIGWLNTFYALIIPSMFSAMGTFLIRQYFLGLPSELMDAARIDGCSVPGTFTRVAMPLARNALVSFGLFSALWAWNDFLWPLILCTSEDMYVVSVALGLFQGQFQTNYALMMSAAAIAVVPILIVFILSQRYIIEGIQMGSLKG